MRTNAQIVNAAGAIKTTDLAAGGALNPEQSKRFLQEVFEATPLLGLIRHETRVAKTGELDKIGIARRILRKKTEDTDDKYRAGVKHSKIEYATTAVRVPWEITEETLRENIEGQRYEDIVTGLMTKQVGCDHEDILVNGDTGVDVGNPDHDFLYVNDGFIKQLEGGSHVVDWAEQNEGAMSMDLFYALLQAIPNKYNNGNLRWLMSPHRRQEWERYILTEAVTHGGVITDNRVENPLSVPTIVVPSMPDDKIILTDPKNLIAVNTYNVVIRKTTEGESAIMQDKRFYVIHFDFDAVIEEMDAAAIIKGLKAPGPVKN